jgi:hypothetical protein
MSSSIAETSGGSSVRGSACVATMIDPPTSVSPDLAAPPSQAAIVKRLLTRKLIRRLIDSRMCNSRLI